MSDLFLYGGNQTPDIIFGKYDTAGLSSGVNSTYSGTDVFKTLSGIRINKYELWFSTTISFIPYSGESVFITDVSGNVTHTGNLLTKGNAVVEKKLTVKDDTTLEKKLTVKDDVIFEKTLTVADKTIIKKDVELAENLTVDKDVKVKKNLFVDGYITATNLSDLESAVGSIGDLTTTIDELKKTIDDMKKQITALEEAAAAG
jgi:predicted acyltransferase (DUF342 family)